MTSHRADPAPPESHETEIRPLANPLELPRLFTLEEAARELHESVKVSTLRTAIRRNQLSARVIGGRYFVTLNALKDFVECPAPAPLHVSTSARTTAPGSSSTAANSNARAMVEASMRKLKERSRTTSRNNDPRGAALQQHRK